MSLLWEIKTCGEILLKKTNDLEEKVKKLEADLLIGQSTNAQHQLPKDMANNYAFSVSSSPIPHAHST